MSFGGAEIRLDGLVAVVTGAGGGLGRAYALALAERGAKILVNDVAAPLRGDSNSIGPGAANGGDTKSRHSPKAKGTAKLPAGDAVAAEICKKGGIAEADYNSVLEPEKIINHAISTFGKVDILICNAGILRDSSFKKMPLRDWRSVIDVHLSGSFGCAHAAWPSMMDQGFGRVIFISSAAGLYGNFGQANYAAAKAGLVGLTNTLSKEGARHGVLVNCIAPLAATRMTESIFPEEIASQLSVDQISPFIVYLASPECQATGVILETAGGWAGAVRPQRSAGVSLVSHPSDTVTPEMVHNNWNAMNDFNNPRYPASLQDSVALVVQSLERARTNRRKDVPQPTTPSRKGATGAVAGKRSGWKSVGRSGSGGSMELQSERIIRLMSDYMELAEEAKDLTEIVNGTYWIVIYKEEMEFKAHNEKKLKAGAANYQGAWTIVLRDENWGIHEGIKFVPDATLVATDQTFREICLGKVTATASFFKGKMKIHGSVTYANKFTPKLFPKITDAMIDGPPTFTDSLASQDIINALLASPPPPADMEGSVAITVYPNGAILGGLVASPSPITTVTYDPLSSPPSVTQSSRDKIPETTNTRIAIGDLDLAYIAANPQQAKELIQQGAIFVSGCTPDAHKFLAALATPPSRL